MRRKTNMSERRINGEAALLGREGEGVYADCRICDEDDRMLDIRLTEAEIQHYAPNRVCVGGPASFAPTTQGGHQGRAQGGAGNGGEHDRAPQAAAAGVPEQLLAARKVLHPAGGGGVRCARNLSDGRGAVLALRVPPRDGRAFRRALVGRILRQGVEPRVGRRDERSAAHAATPPTGRAGGSRWAVLALCPPSDWAA